MSDVVSPADPIAARVRRGLPLQGVRVVDCHAHLGALAELHIADPGADGLVALMDRLGVESCCPSAHLAIGADYRWGNDLVAEAMAAHSGRILGYVVVNPNYPQDVLPEIERCFARAPFVGIKLHPEWHGYPPDGPNYEPALGYAHERGLAVLSHSWGPASHLERVSRRYPGASFIAAHVGAAWSGRTPLEHLRVARERPNVYLDTVISVVWYGALERLVAEVGEGSVLFGTDMPFIDPGVALGRVAFAGLRDDARERILGGNMLEVLSRHR
jgi:predicted TIM-barrel fold metal-dependent hydrolase